MKGLILVVNEQKEAGSIATTTGQRYLFPLSEWKEDLTSPERGMLVEFDPDGEGRASNVRLALSDAEQASTTASSELVRTNVQAAYHPKPKKKSVLTLLGIFLGLFGAHKFYLGEWGWGIVYIFGAIVLNVLTAIHPLFGFFLFAFSIFVIVEFIRYILMTDAQFEEKLKAYQARNPGPFSFFW